MKIKNELIVLCLLLLFMLISISAVSATNDNIDVITSDYNNDNVLEINNLNNGDILTDGNDGSFAALNTVVNGDSSTNIVLENDFTYSSSDTITDGIVISKNNTVIDGKGHTIDAKGKSRIFNINATTVTLKNITFVNGYNVNGGAIRGYGDNLRVFNCTFINNTADSWGGAILSYPDSYSVFVDSTFINNKAKYGGALAAYYGLKQEVIRCNFDSNHATNSGGGLLTYGDLATTENPYDEYLNIKGCVFINNEAPEGDAISNYLCTIINLTDSAILGNPETAVYSWGRMFTADNNWWGNTVDNSSVRPNVDKNVEFNRWLYLDLAPHIESSSATVSINNVYDNQTGKTGVYSTSRLPSLNVEFSAVNATLDVDNADLDHSGKYELDFVLLGDAILTANCEGISVSKSIKCGSLTELSRLIKTAGNNTVLKLERDYSYIPGVDALNRRIVISDKHNLVIDGNGHTVRGMGKTTLFALTKNSSDITFKNMDILNAYSDGDYDGPAAIVYADNTQFMNCTFANNTAEGLDTGGAIYLDAADCTVSDCKFINNSHKHNSAGAIYWKGTGANVMNTLFENNSANSERDTDSQARAGALLLYKGGNVVNCTFINNSADYAGALYSSGKSTIDDCTFIDNIAFTDKIQFDNNVIGGGGAIYVYDAQISDSVFVNNTGSCGGAIVMNSPSATIDKSVFINNTATSSNGIIFSTVEGGKVSNSIFLNNDVGYGGYLISEIWDKLQADHNWFGNIEKDYSQTPNVSNLANMTKWLFLNATTPVFSDDGKYLTTSFNLFEYDDNTGDVVPYDLNKLPQINLTISTQNLTIDKNVFSPGETIEGNLTYHVSIGEEGYVYRYDNMGTITAECEDVKYVLPFKFVQETWFEANSTFEIPKLESKYLDLSLHPFDDDYVLFLCIYDRITYEIENTSIIEYNKNTGKIKGLKVGLTNITFRFDGKTVIGEDKYLPANITVLVNVTKMWTQVCNVTSVPNESMVGENGNFIIGLYDYRNKSVSGHFEYELINNNPDVITASLSGSNIQYRTIGEGLANLTVKFAGNDECLPSSRDFTFQVGRKDPNLRVDPEYISMNVSKDYLVAIFKDSSDNFTYISNDTSVAIMDENGVHAIGEGVANITVKFGGDDRYHPASAYVIVNVTSVKTYVDVNPTENMLLTDSMYLDASVRDTNGKLVNRYVSFTSNDTSVVTVDEDGKMVAVGEGVANITVTFNGRDEYAPSKANVIVTVAVGESNITVNPNVELILNQNVKLNATLNHEGTLNYSSSNSSVVSVDNYGRIYAKAIGEATITITYAGSQKYEPCTANVTVKVSRIPTSIDVGKTFSLIINEEDVIAATLNPNAGSLTFTSNNESIVTVDNNGKVSAIDVGKTTVLISFAGNGNYLPSNATVEVTVCRSNITTSIEVNKTFDLFVGDVVDMDAVLNPSNAGKLTYISNNPDVVSIDENGKMTAKKVGQAVISISFAGNNVFLANSTNVTVNVSLIPTSISANDSITVNLTEATGLDYVFSHPEAGQLEFIFDDSNIASMENGKLKGDEVGKTNLTIKFEGNEKYAPSNKTIEIIVKDVETTIDVDDTIEVNVTETETIPATLNPKGAGKLRFVNNNQDIFTVDGNGKVYGIKLGNGTVTIIFDGDGKYRAANKTVKVIVKDVETTIDVNDSIDVNVTEKVSIIASANPKEAGKLKFSTNDNDIISLDEKGNVKGLKVGTASVLITLDANGKYRGANKTVTVNVCNVKTEIDADNYINLVYGDEKRINASLSPIAGELTYASNDTGIVTVDESGIVKAVKPGVAEITISFAGEGKYGPANKTVIVAVERAPSSIEINDTMDLEIGIGLFLHPTTNPKKLDLTYKSNDSDTVEIDNSGFVFPVSKGSAVITISFGGNEYYLPSNATVNVNVIPRQTEIQVNDTVALEFGDSLDLGAELILPTAMMPIDGELKYSSSNPSIVSVDEKVGLITANGVGNATITISYAGNNQNAPSNATVKVEVTPKATSVKADKSSIELAVGDTYNAGAELVNGPAGAALTYVSSNPDVASVNSATGEITAKGKGNATITVKYAGNNNYKSSSADISVTVSKYTSNIESEDSYDMHVNDNLNLNAEVTPNGGTLTYTSSDSNVVTVDSNGNVKAIKPGNATITIKYAGDNKYAPCQKEVSVKVSQIPTSIKLSDINLYPGEKYSLNGIISPSDAPNDAGYYVYSSGDTKVFTVENGVITAVKEGSAKLYVEFKGNDKYLPSSATAVVKVAKKELSDDDYEISVDVDDYNKKATFTIELPKDATGKFQVVVGGETHEAVASNGKAVVVVDQLKPGDYNATLKYSGDKKYADVNNDTSFHIGKYKIDKNKDVDVLLGNTAKYTVHLTRDTQAMEGKTITFKVNGKTYKAVTDRLGYASIKVKLPAMKTYTVTAQYDGVKVSNKIRVHVIVAKNLKTTKSKDLKVKVSLKKVKNKYLSGKKVTLKFKGKTYTGKTNKKGVVTFTIKKSVLAKLKVGKSYKYTVKYSKDTVSKTIKRYK